MDKDLRGGRFRRVSNYLRFCELYRPGMEEEEEEILGMVFSRVMGLLSFRESEGEWGRALSSLVQGIIVLYLWLRVSFRDFRVTMILVLVLSFAFIVIKFYLRLINLQYFMLLHAYRLI